MSEFEKTFPEMKIDGTHTFMEKGIDDEIRMWRKEGYIAALKCMLEHRYEVVDERLKFPMDVIDAKHLEKEIEEVENND